MINKIYHRVQTPWVYELEETGKIRIVVMADMDVDNINLVWTEAQGAYGGDHQPEVTMRVETIVNNKKYFVGELQVFSKRIKYILKVTTNNSEGYVGWYRNLDHEDELQKPEDAFVYSYWNKANRNNVPDWFSKTSWYQIFPDRFNRVGKQENYADWNKIKPNGHEYYGGNIEGIIEKLDYIKDMGFTGIYMTPIFDSRTAHRYETHNYNEIDPILGNDTIFKKFIEEAKKRGIRIMLDGVFNHIGYHSIQFQDVVKNGKESKYADWFFINDWNNLKPGGGNDYSNEEMVENYPYETFAWFADMPRMNWENEATKKYLLDAVKKWTSMGIDGWRLDVSFEPSNPFWRSFRKTVLSINPDAAIIGEVWWDSISWMQGDMWHGVMNYPLRDLIIRYIRHDQTEWDKERFVEEFNSISYKYTPEQQWGMFNLISSHDVTRFITLLGGSVEKFKAAMKIVYMMPGAPSTYYGEEIGLEGEHDPDNRRPMPWGQVRVSELPSFIKELNKERANKFLPNSSKFERSIAKIIDNRIIIINSNTELVINGLDVSLNIKGE